MLSPQAKDTRSARTPGAAARGRRGREVRMPFAPNGCVLNTRPRRRWSPHGAPPNKPRVRLRAVQRAPGVGSGVVGGAPARRDASRAACAAGTALRPDPGGPTKHTGPTTADPAPGAPGASRWAEGSTTPRLRAAKRSWGPFAHAPVPTPDWGLPRVQRPLAGR